MVDRSTNRTGNGIIQHILPRKSIFRRKVAGNTSHEQIIATNIEKVFICMALTNDFNVRRLERYIIMSWDSGATPIIVLTKSDLCKNIDECFIQAEEVAMGVKTIVSSAINGLGIDEIRKSIDDKDTVAFIGSSGIGKSTIINQLVGNSVQKVMETRSDDKGRHTTTHRELFILPTGGVVVDTPGMRELHLMGDTSNVSQTFDDVEQLIKLCKFTDCTHTNEPGCAIIKALEEGELSKDRFNSYFKVTKRSKVYCI